MAPLGTAPTHSEHALAPRAVWMGALLALAFAVAWVGWNGFVVDETVISAQILTGDVHYPAGHPHLVFHRQAWSLSNQLSALLWMLRPDAAFVSAVRNVLCLFLTLFTPYLLTLVLTRSSAWAASAAALVLADGLARFGGVYPDFVLPTFYSHGHVGAYGLVLVVALTLAGRARLAGFLLGLFPAIHPLLGVLAWAWGAVFLVAVPGAPRGGERRRYLAAAASGALLALLSLLASRAMVPEPVTAGVYGVGDDGAAVRASFIALTDVHRQMPGWRTPTFWFGYVAGALLLATLLLDARPRAAGHEPLERTARAPLAGLALLGALVWSLIAATRLVLAARGALPGPLETAMPNRLSNVSLLLLVPLAVAALARAAERAPRLVWALGALVLASGAIAAREAWLGGWVGETQRALPGMLLLGAALGASTAGTRGVARVASLAFGLGFLGLHVWLAAGVSPWPPAGFALAFVGAAALARGARVQGAASGATVLLTAALLALVAHLPRAVDSSARADAEAVRVTAFDRALTDWLERNASRDEFLLPPLVPRTQLQAKTGHPVLFELGTLWLMPYLPEVSAVIGRMIADLYGVDYADPVALRRLAPEGRLGQWSPVWRRAWERRSAAEWGVLGARWNFRLVLAPTDWQVDLPAEVVSTAWTLYVLPPS